MNEKPLTPFVPTKFEDDVDLPSTTLEYSSSEAGLASASADFFGGGFPASKQKREGPPEPSRSSCQGSAPTPGKIKKSICTKRNKTLKVRVSDEEHERLLALAEGEQLATWMRRRSLMVYGGRPEKSRLEENKRLIRELSAIGRNLNQIAKTANIFKEHTDLVRLVEEVSLIRAELEVLRRDNAG